MDPKRFLFVSADAALIGDVAWQVAREGHDVRYYVEAESDREIADGFVTKTDDWRSEVEWADTIVSDDIGERWIDGDGDRLQAWGYLGPES
jgi:phosphoribosylamine--glycine ligase